MTTSPATARPAPAESPPITTREGGVPCESTHSYAFRASSTRRGKRILRRKSIVHVQNANTGAPHEMRAVGAVRESGGDAVPAAVEIDEERVVAAVLALLQERFDAVRGHRCGSRSLRRRQ